MGKLTNAQKSIWITEQYYNGSSVNNICGTAVIQEKVDFDKLEKSIKNVCQKHDNFWLEFKLEDGEIKQELSERENVQIDIINVENQKELEKQQEKIVKTKFKLENSKLFKFYIFKFANGKGAFVLNIHHLISDAWTLALICNEIIKTYSNLKQNKEIQTKAIYSYIDYIKSEQEYQKSEKFNKDKKYWKNRFKTLPEVATIPGSVKENVDSSIPIGRRKQYEIKKEQIEKIKKYCKDNRISIYNFFMAVYAIYISEICNLDEFVIGTPILNRTNFKEKNAPGMFINIAPFKINIDESLGFKTFAKKIAMDSMDMLKHQKYSYQCLLEDLRKEDSNIPNLYNILLSYQVTNAQQTEGDVKYSTEWTFNGCCADDIDIQIYDLNDTGNLNIAYDYKTSIYNQEDIENIHKRVFYIINQVIDQENIELKDIEIVTSEEKEKLLIEFNNTKLEYNKNIPFIKYFEAQVEKTPDNIAIVFENKNMTYKELNEKANSLAYELRKNGVTNNTIVGILQERSFEMMIAILAVLKSGGCYIPIAPDYPNDRIEYMLKDSNAKTLLTCENSRIQTDKQIINIKDEKIYKEHRDNLENISKPEDLSYLIYTSGSTGTPKGVMLKQQNLSNFYNSMKETIDYLNDEKQHKILSITTVSFDIFAFETLMSLTRGLTVYMTNENEQKITSEIERIIKDNEVEIMQTTPSVMKFHLENIKDYNNIKSLKYVMLAGEPLSKTLVDKLKDIIPNVTVYNGYGPSETTIFSTVANVTKEEVITIGKPIHNTQIYILNKNKKIMPQGTIGELYISGDGVGKGYMNKAKQTKESFLANPFDTKKTMYKVGDLGAFNKHGEIVCYGRVDHQVKIRGLRIELSEIEKQMLLVHNIADCVVVKKQIKDKDALCAYYIQDGYVDKNALRIALHAKLPEYMVPQYFVKMDIFPHTPNGKIDKKALPVPDLKEAKVKIVKPRNEIDKKLVRIIEKMLHISKVSIEDTLLELGGDSLTAITLSTKILSNFNVQINIKDILSNYTIRDMSDYIDNNKTDDITKIKIDRIKEQETYQLSSAQKRIYYNAKMIGNDNIVYNMPGGIITDEILDVEKIKEVFNRIIERHEILRTKFVISNDEVVQKVCDNVNFEIPVYHNTEKEIPEIIKNFSRPFNLENELLMRTEVHFIDNKSTMLLVDSHHIIMDGMSLNNLIIEFNRLYNGDRLKRLPIQYRDYSSWENNYINSDLINENEKYWIDKFKDCEFAQLNLPYDYKIPANRSYNGNKICNIIDEKQFRKIERYAKKIGTSPYMFFITVFLVLLYKYTGQEEITLGSPIANRDKNETKRMMGMLVNNIVVKGKIDINKSFKELLDEMKDQILNDLSNQPYPFDMLVKKLGIKTDNSRNPLFDAMFIYQNKEENIVKLNEKDVNVLEIDNNISKFNLSLEIKPKTHTINIEYCTDLFKQDTIERLFEHYINTIDYIMDDVNVKIKDIEIISGNEKNKILYEFNKTNMDYSKDKTVVQLFEEQVEKTPENVAVVFEGKKITYKELNQKANQLAIFLRGNNIKANEIVGIMLSRSIELISTIIGVLKSGACYIPIDPSYPEQRIKYMLKNSNAKILLTDSGLIKTVEFQNKVSVNFENEEIYKLENKNLSNINKPEDMSYIIYTSGSTGLPKGVILKHKSLSNLCAYLNKKVEFLQEECSCKNMASVTTASFDIFIFETLVCLQKGLKVILANEEEQRIPQALDKLIKENDIQLIQMTPSRMQMFLDNIEEMPNLSNLKYVTLAGEALPLQLRDELVKLGVKKVYNGYGPSETTVFSTFTDVTEKKEINIGVPLANTQMYILDKNLNIVPIGVAGDLYIAGDGVGKGYLNRKDITNERYLKNPFISDSIMYKTGDVCKYDKNGEIYYLGRSDNQVKIRGLRIELEEIENKILEFPCVKKVKVIKQLIGNREVISAYFITTTSIRIPELRKYLYDRLPNYMVPAYFTRLQQFPYTPNGKIDKNELAKMINLKNQDKEIIKPTNELEEKITNIFKKVLELNQVGINEDFFELGGDSITAMKLQIEASRENIDIEYGKIFEYPTIHSLAENIRERDLNTNKISKVKEREFYPLSSAQRRIFIASSLDEGTEVYNIIGGILLNNVINVERLQKAIDIIIQKNESLRTYFDILDNGEIVQKIDVKSKVRVHVKYAESNDIEKAFENAKKIYNLRKAPLVDINVFLFPNRKTFLTLNVHHIICDGESLKLLLEQLAKAYDGEDIEENEISYKDFAVWEERQLIDDKFSKSKEYWKNQFQQGIPILNMPTSYPRPAQKSFEGDTFEVEISEELTEKIIKFAKEHDVTVYMLLLTCYYIVLYKYTGQEDIIVGSPISGRIYQELEKVLGMFVNTLPLKNKIISNESFIDLLMSIKRNIVKAYEHQNYPLNELVNELNIARDSCRNPLFDTMFIYQNNIFSKVKINGEEAEYCIPKSHTSKFDLSVETILIKNKFKMIFEYWTRLFNEKFISDFANHYINIVSSVITNSNIKITDIDMLNKTEKEKILYEFNDTKMKYDKEKTIIDLFEEQVKKTPDNIAVVFGNNSITYKELNEKANQLARCLLKRGIGNGSVVGIKLPRGMEVLISIIAVLKTGACYIPIDPELPQGRIEYMISNSNVECLLVMNTDNDEFEINVSLNNSSIYKGTNSNPNIKIDPESRSYMIYTSGSTGNPKGVILKHKSLSNLANYLNQKVQFLKDEYSNIAIASITTISFDIFIFETLICLQRGLKVVMANEEEQNTPSLLDELIMKNNVKAIQMTPSRMYIFINNKNIMPHLNELKYIVLAGEALPMDLLKRILLLGDITVYNGYGPSETTVFSTFTDVTKSKDITIGKPLANTRMYILNNDNNICPIGQPGEIYIAGDGVGIGYNNEDLTKERFVQDIFYENEIMYKTGDLGTFLPNGEIHYIGRVDNQIKIRGLRIELDEIEKSILKYKNIDKCIIVSNVDNNKRQFIVAYLTVTNRISINKLRAFLKTILPKYMIPSYFVILDEIPYLNNGKIDKKSLPKVEINNSQEQKNEYVAPRDNLELQLVNIYQNLLSISPIGIDDNFFELGGDSLLAINLQVELMKQKMNITYTDIFENPTVRNLAEKITSEKKKIFKGISKEEFVEFEDILQNTCNEISDIRKKEIGNVLITGVTGFLGAHVLDTFLKRESGVVYCAIRTEAGLTLENKLLDKLHFYFGNKYDKYLGNRIIIVKADLTQNNLGMVEENINKTFDKVDCVINCAAKVSHYGDYSEYKKVNVVGTENLLKLCMKYNKRFYHISTLSVSGNSLVDQSYIEQSFEEDVIFKENNFYINQSLDNVYVRSKFEAEKIILQYINKGLNGYICRVGNLMSRYSDGKFQPNVDENAYIGRLVSLLKIGCIPDYMLNSYMEFTPIDCCAEAIIKLMQYPSEQNRIFHLYNNNHVNIEDFIDVLRKYKNMEVVSNEVFMKKIDELLTRKDFSNILSGVLRDFNQDKKIVYESKIKLDEEFTNKYLDKIHFKWPIIDKKYIENFIEYFYKIGYITKEEK